jgi:hypothetical protein
LFKRPTFTSGIPEPAAAGSIQHIPPAINAYTKHIDRYEKKADGQFPASMYLLEALNLAVVSSDMKNWTTTPSNPTNTPVSTTNVYTYAINSEYY